MGLTLCVPGSAQHHTRTMHSGPRCLLNQVPQARRHSAVGIPLTAQGKENKEVKDTTFAPHGGNQDKGGWKTEVDRCEEQVWRCI